MKSRGDNSEGDYIAFFNSDDYVGSDFASGGDLCFMDYKDTNLVRYEKVDYEAVEGNIYAAVNPVGKYCYYIAFKTARWFIKMLHDRSNKRYRDLKVLDVGCGDGHITRMMVSLLDCAENVYGFDFSENNIKHCKQLNGSVNYSVGDITGCMPFEAQFDGISAFVVLSHLRKENDVKAALKNIYNALNDNGLFLWYELISKSHYINPDKDTQGFNSTELERYANEAGFKEIARKSFSKTIWIGNKSKSIYYFAKEHNIWFLELLSRILPMRPTITIRLYKKV